MGVPIFLNSPTTVLKSIAILDPPAVEPAHPPTNIRRRRTVLENTGHVSKSTVEYPVVVITDETVKNTSLNKRLILVYEDDIFTEIAIIAIATIPQ